MRAVPDPDRLVESTEAPESLRAALCSARADTANARELRALAASLAPQLGSGGGGGASAGSAGAKAGSGSLKWMILSGVVVGGVALVVASRPNAPVAPADSPSVSAPAVALEPPATQASAVQGPAGSAEPQGGPPADASTAQPPAGASAPGRVVREPRPLSKPAVQPDAVADRKPSEASLLDAARKALQSNPKQALALTDEHRALYPNGMLVQEREVIAIEALRRMGATDAADQRNRAFGAAYPTTIHGREVQTESGGEKK
jgi:hypothetical protein